MVAKLTFFDVENNEITPPKLALGVSLTNAVSVTTGALIQASVAGAIAIDATNGIAYRAWNTSSTFEVLNSNGGIYGVHQLTVTVNAAVTSTDGTAPVVGDYVGIFGAGAWALSGNLIVSRSNHAGCGSQNAGLIGGGVNNGGGVNCVTSTELFNGSTWVASSNLILSRDNHAMVGSQNASLIGGGVNTGAGLVTSTELFNGSTWVAGNNLSLSRTQFGAFGTQAASLAAGGLNAGSNGVSSTELFNGSVWTASGNLNISRSQDFANGTLYAGIVIGGLLGGAATAISNVEIFNGSTWATSGNLVVGRTIGASAGTQNSSMASGGKNAAANAVTTSEVFNGSTWALSGNMVASRSNFATIGSQNAAVANGGLPAGITQQLSEIHTQSTWRCMTAKAFYTTPLTGILSSAGVVTLQGIVNMSFTFPANIYLVLNRGNDFQTAPNATLTIGLASVLGGGSSWTYNFGNSVTVSNVCTGMLAVATGGGATPITGGNVGTFVINKVVSPNSIQVTNANGSSQNPGTGSLNIISSVIAKSSPSPQDIVVAYSDGSGILNVIRQPKIGFWSQALK